MTNVIEQLAQHRIVPVIALDKVSQAAPLAEALVEGGLPVAEVTFRTAAAAESIKIMAERGDMIVGAGTVLTIDQAKEAVDNGATFLISPGINPKVVKYCVDNNIIITPGISNPTDIELALDLGLKVVKFFPAEAVGGLPLLKAVAAPYNMMNFIPTGGINANNVTKYLEFDKVLACGGSWMVAPSLYEAGDFSKVVELTKEAVAVAASVK
ncbi:bifunctional 4-hydroxy-2-oxoglutarate aldolase/2-dehydro-3-deoxy-phosphogluconate aldolase [Persicirhabdus sediminis]|uniref:2-dehydro-3-deoxy-phosphogluconate aldolase n=1 Tax=Persicirhabdus sediminis TaxID=454144 RepID=A0A8J7MFD6_9BACT|nr:bifunctional 4-hydroxy-2-oxoglutarate aldolase/2-dehydro-3-deoxy-phosphogluconate aldolase [Persicirhabdus sediminis]MBK1790789.1 bifunctional 4-hydroxy-2-oxoglutarate aldolase/2-dehydro-3-deoxy-phosphogluconate aldolase [Persicirhabdus sediminis]